MIEPIELLKDKRDEVYDLIQTWNKNKDDKHYKSVIESLHKEHYAYRMAIKILSNNEKQLSNSVP